MASPVDRIQYPYLDTLNNSSFENLNLYTNATVDITESERYDLTISKWNNVYQELEYIVSTFG